MKFSIKTKWTLFIVLLLIINITFTSFFILKGVLENQKEYYEELLKEHSKNTNLYIRESFISSDFDNFEEFYVSESENLLLSLKRMIALPIAIYNKDGEILCSGDNIIKDRQPLDIMKKALKGQCIYEKKGNQIIYLAPIYDFDNQIGVIKIRYMAEREELFFENIKALFYKIGIMSIIFASLIGILYFSKIVDKILKLKNSVQAIEQGDYDSIEKLDSQDELGNLSDGICFMATTIKQNIEDITNEKEKLELAINKLEKLEKQQKEFIGNITHEFKTPLTILKAQLDLISMYKDDEDMAKNARIIAEKELKRLNGMIEKTLALSKVEKFDFEFKKEKINSKLFLEDISMRMKGKASKYEIEIKEDLQDAIIFIDAESFMQIFINLIDNAIKYNVRNGKIYIRSFLKEDKNYIQIEDTGIGISKEDREKIFEPFYTVDKTRARGFSGTGLGLPLVRSLVKNQSGTIRLLENEKTTCFEIVFPLHNY